MTEQPLPRLPELMHIYHWRHYDKPVLEIWFVKLQRMGSGRSFVPQRFSEELVYSQFDYHPPRLDSERYAVVNGLSELDAWLANNGYDSEDERNLIVSYALECWFINLSRQPPPPTAQRSA